MRLTVNGEATELVDGATVADLVGLVARSARGVAVSVDRAVVPRSAWSTAPLRDGSSVEILTAAAGG